jgi:hypothetical protein
MKQRSQATGSRKTQAFRPNDLTPSTLAALMCRAGGPSWSSFTHPLMSVVASHAVHPRAPLSIVILPVARIGAAALRVQENVGGLEVLDALVHHPALQKTSHSSGEVRQPEVQQVEVLSESEATAKRRRQAAKVGVAAALVGMHTCCLHTWAIQPLKPEAHGSLTAAMTTTPTIGITSFCRNSRHASGSARETR